LSRRLKLFKSCDPIVPQAWGFLLLYHFGTVLRCQLKSGYKVLLGGKAPYNHFFIPPKEIYCFYELKSSIAHFNNFVKS